MIGSPGTILLAILLDAALGDPDVIYRRVRHPVVIIGRFIGFLDRHLNREKDSAGRRRAAGVAACLLLLAAALGIGWAFQATFRIAPADWLTEAVLLSVFLAQKGLYLHVAAVARTLSSAGLPAGRVEVSRIVGRDPESLDEPAVCRAALESLAENFSDGVTAPLFWALLLGLPGIIAYKAINTADSMIGHLTPRHRAFGWASARLDDALNFVPARLAGLILALAALLVPRASAAGAFAAMARGARRHRSPNAGWPESAMAGALGIALAGPRRYASEVVDDPWMNAGGRAAATTADIRRGLTLYTVACALQAAMIAALALL
jgi:adenosylcobinamide-phosphate synthase